MSPRASTLMSPVVGAIPRSRSSSGVTVVPSSKRSARVSRFTTSYSTRNGLWKPRFGTRRCSGIWPPSNPRLNLNPERDFAPLWPRPAVLPLPDPWPRPMRFLGCFIPFGGRRLLRLISIAKFSLSLRYFDQVTHLVDHASHRRRVLQFHGVTDSAQAEPLHDRRLIAVEPGRALHQRHLDGVAL